MKRGDQMRKRSPTAESKCSKTLLSKPVPPNGISWSETEAGGPREDPSDEGKSVSVLRFVIQHRGHSCLSFQVLLKSFCQTPSTSGCFFSFVYFCILEVDFYQNLLIAPCFQYFWYFYSCLRPFTLKLWNSISKMIIISCLKEEKE